MKLNKRFILFISLLSTTSWLPAQNRYELNSGWKCAGINQVKQPGTAVSQPGFKLDGWLPATVPGTVLTTLLNNQMVPDPFWGMNNKYIPDVYHTGNDFYTYWFVKDFKEKALPGEQVWLQLRGVNYTCEVFLNGKKLNAQTHEGMLLRQQYNITDVLHTDGHNRLAILVFPPTIPGNPNGGQGGDGTIARMATTQYTAGWDWIQPMRDRNTGIWDKVTIEKTSFIDVRNPHVVTLVPGKRFPDAPQQPAIIRLSTEVENPTATVLSGLLQYSINGVTVKKNVRLAAKSTEEIQLPDVVLQNPKLWWPNGYGKQDLYALHIQFIGSGKILDEEKLTIGIRQVDNVWNNQTGSMQTLINGQKIFIKGGNWIISDAMLRFSRERYDAEIRFHRDMNLNLIRIWGGALTERPEFYEACDKYGLLVFQDFWFSGDCNGRWLDPMKKEDQWTRRKYPNNHSLVLTIAADQIKMIRNHPSLAFWCGGNEITPPDDILYPLRDSILPKLDGTRYFFDYSNSDSMSYNNIGGNGDGPYTIQNDKTFWANKTFPFNSEVGSVGLGDYVSLQRFIPKENLVPPTHPDFTDSVWEYHKYIPYENYAGQYGAIKDAKDFAMKAQLVNYNQYRALIEGFSANMWKWYTGTIIWKTQNPWTALRGQMYDYYLDVNACLYGLRNGSKPLHIMMNPTDSMIVLVNNGFVRKTNLMLQVKTYDVLTGKDSLYTLLFQEIGPSMSQNVFKIGSFLKALNKPDGIFVSLRLFSQNKELIDDNFYWLPATNGRYEALQQMKPALLKMEASAEEAGKIRVTLSNKADGPVAFFNRIALVSQETGERILPGFYSDNYISVLPGETTSVVVEFPAKFAHLKKRIVLYGWNVPEQTCEIK